MFKRRQKYKWTDKAAGKIACAGIKAQARFADSMNLIISKVSVRRLKTLLILFCVLWGGLSAWFIGKAVFGSDEGQPTFNVKQIKMPEHLNKNGSEINEIENGVSDDVYLQIQRYKRYMDSMKLPIRESLLDSINLLEQIYKRNDYE